MRFSETTSSSECNFGVVRATPGQKSPATASVMYDYLTKEKAFFSTGMQFSYFPYPGYSHRQLGNKTEMYHMEEGDHSAADCARACNRRTDCEGYVHHFTINRGFSKLLIEDFRNFQIGIFPLYKYENELEIDISDIDFNLVSP